MRSIHESPDPGTPQCPDSATPKHPDWCARRGEPADACDNAHAGSVTYLSAVNGYSTVTVGLVDGDPVVELGTYTHDALGSPVLLSPAQAEYVAARLTAAVVALTGLDRAGV